MTVYSLNGIYGERVKMLHYFNLILCCQPLSQFHRTLFSVLTFTFTFTFTFGAGAVKLPSAEAVLSSAQCASPI